MTEPFDRDSHPDSDPNFWVRARRFTTRAIDALFDGIPNWVLLVAGTIVWGLVFAFFALASTSVHTP